MAHRVKSCGIVRHNLWICSFVVQQIDQHNKRGDVSDRQLDASLAALVVLITSSTTCQDVVNLLHNFHFKALSTLSPKTETVACCGREAARTMP